MHTYLAQWIGAFALEVLNQTQPQTGKVLGVTSKDIFLLFGRKSVFLTSIAEKSPFNIYLEEGKEVFSGIQTGEEVAFSAGELVLRESGRVVDISRAGLWRPTSPRLMTTTHEEQIVQCGAILRSLIAVDPHKGLLFLTGQLEMVDQSFQSIKENSMAFKTAFQHENLVLCVKTADSIMGLGTGLTPSGDDLLAGFLLWQTRLDQASGNERPFVQQLGKALTELAYQKTTWVSANRIEAACRGWSEDLFLQIIDSILDGSAGLPPDIVERLMRFGHSSGVGTFVGILLAIGAI